MKPSLAPMVALAALVAAPVGAPLPAAAQGERSVVLRRAKLPVETQARVIVKFRADGALSREAIARAGPRAGARAQHAARLSQRLGLDLRDGIAVAPRVQVIKARGLSSAELVARLAKDPDVEYAEVDQRVRIAAAPNDPLYALGITNTTPWAGQWYLRAPGEPVVTFNGSYGADPASRVVSAINAEGAWRLTTGSASAVVAVLDTGVRPEHPDLAGKLLPGRDFVSADAVNDFRTANDGDGWDDDPSDPGDWISFDEDTALGGLFAGCGESPSSWHGTQTAGLVGAAANNGVGMTGSAPDIKILPVRVLGKCGGFQSDIAAGMRWAAGLNHPDVSWVPANPYPAKVVNLSLGSVGACGQTYADAVRELTAAGVAVVVAAGNEDGYAVNRPANCEGAIGVAGIRHSGTKVGYSNVGPELTVAAPAGNCIYVGVGEPCVYPLLTTINFGPTTPTDNGYTGSYADASYGTSFATPLVAGTVALMMSADPLATPAQIRQRLRDTARPFPSTGADANVTACRAPNQSSQFECYCTTTTCGAGMLDAAAAVAASVPGYTVVFGGEAGLLVKGGPVSLNTVGTAVPAGRTIAAYEWTLSPGASGATLQSALDADAAIVIPQRGGAFSLSLAVVDDAGILARTTRHFVVVGSPTAAIQSPGSTPRVGSSFTLNGSGSTAYPGFSIASYQWVVVNGNSVAEITAGATTATPTFTAKQIGSFTVNLTVVDSGGEQISTSAVVDVAAASSGGGGGAMSAAWLAGLALAVAALSVRRWPRLAQAPRRA